MPVASRGSESGSGVCEMDMLPNVLRVPLALLSKIPALCARAEAGNANERINKCGAIAIRHGPPKERRAVKIFINDLDAAVFIAVSVIC